MNLRLSMIFCFIWSTATLAAPSVGQVITIKGVVVDPSKGPIDAVSVFLYEVDRSRKEVAAIGLSKTAADGKYEFNLEKPRLRLELICLKSNDAQQNFYGPNNFIPLAGTSNLTVNIALDPAEHESLAMSRDRMTQINHLLDVEQKFKTKLSPDWAVGYVVASVHERRSQADFSYSRELATLVDRLRPFNEQVAATKKMAVVSSLTGVATYRLPTDSKKPELLAGKHTKIPRVGGWLGVVDNQFFALQPGKFEDSAAWTMVWEEPSDASRAKIHNFNWPVTSATAAPSMPVLITGRPNGTIDVHGPDFGDRSATFEVGTTPVAASAISKDASLWAAATMDGTYRIWRRKARSPLTSAEAVRKGTLSLAFPSSMTFSPDRKFLIIATGIKTFDNGLTVLDVDNAGHPEMVTKTPHTVTKIDFVADTDTFLTGSSDGTTTVCKLVRGVAETRANPEFDLSGVMAFGLDPTGDTAVLKVSGRDQPVAFPTEQLLNANVNKTGFGIEVKYQNE